MSYKPAYSAVIRCLVSIILLVSFFTCTENNEVEVKLTPPIPSYYEGSNTRSIELNLQGRQLMVAGQYDQATPLFLEAIKEDKKNVDAWDHLGICYRRTGEADKAINAYETSIKINPDNPVPYGNLGLIYRLRKDFDKARDYYSKAIDIDPRDPEGYYGLGTVCQLMKAYDEAIKWFLKAAELYERTDSPLLGDAYHALGACYCLKKPPDNVQAANYFLKAKKLGTELQPNIEAFVKQVLQ